VVGGPLADSRRAKGGGNLVVDVPALVIVVLLAGILLALADVLQGLATNRLRRPTSSRPPLVFDLRVLLIALVSTVAVPASLGMLLGSKDPARLIEIQLLAHGLILGLVLAAMGTGKNSFSAYGIDAYDWRAEMRYGCLAFLAAVPPVLCVLALVAPYRTPDTQHPFLKLVSGGPADRTLVEVAIAAVVTAPLVEELIFRVVFQGLLQSVLRPWLAILIPAAVFAGVHQGLDRLPLLPLAIVLGVLHYYRRSYVAVVTTHALFNAANLAIALLTRAS
jgi:membrane protease YdiL (CAAX protease family)